MNIRELIFYALLAGIPAWFINRWLLKRLKPTISFKNFLLYLLLVLVIAFAYTAVIAFILFKYVWPLQ